MPDRPEQTWVGRPTELLEDEVFPGCRGTLQQVCTYLERNDLVDEAAILATMHDRASGIVRAHANATVYPNLSLTSLGWSDGTRSVRRSHTDVCLRFDAVDSPGILAHPGVLGLGLLASFLDLLVALDTARGPETLLHVFHREVHTFELLAEFFDDLPLAQRTDTLVNIGWASWPFDQWELFAARLSAHPPEVRVEALD